MSLGVGVSAAVSTVRGVWTPTPDEDLEAEIRAALSRSSASRIDPPKPVSCSDGRAGWLFGRMVLPDGSWAGLAWLQREPFEVRQLTWRPAGELRVLA